jgi:hypothetical protein
MPQLISAFGRALSSPLEKGIFDEISSTLRTIAQQNPQAFESTLSGCSEKERASIVKLFSTQ